MSTDLGNPWAIQSIFELLYFNCPSCGYKDHSKQEFINHAYEHHPKSIEHLIQIKDDLIDIDLPWELKEIKIEYTNTNDASETHNIVCEPNLEVFKTEYITGINNFSDDISETKSIIDNQDDDEIKVKELLENNVKLKKCSVGLIPLKIYTCRPCNNNFYSQIDFKIHINAFHTKKKSIEKSKKSVSGVKETLITIMKDRFNRHCNICHRIFKNKFSLNVHIYRAHKSHKKISNHVNFSKKSEIKKKMCVVVLTPLKPHYCNICQKFYSSPFALENHFKLIHSIFMKDRICYPAINTDPNKNNS